MSVPVHKHRSAGRRGSPHGFSLTELLMIIALIGLTVGLAALSWSRVSGRVRTASAARTTKTMIHRARMQAIYRGVNHYLVFQPATGRLEVFADTGTDRDDFDAGDERVAGASIGEGVQVALPAGATLSSPLGGGSLSTAWSLPAPTADGWSSGQRGLVATPRGQIESAESTPQVITTGVIVFSNSGKGTAAVTISGTLGSIRSFEYFEGQWKEI